MQVVFPHRNEILYTWLAIHAYIHALILFISVKSKEEGKEGPTFESSSEKIIHYSLSLEITMYLHILNRDIRYANTVFFYYGIISDNTTSSYSMLL